MSNQGNPARRLSGRARTDTFDYRSTNTILTFSNYDCLDDQMKIGLLSDTHGYLDPRIKSWVAECDEVWHAGDVGSMEIAEEITSWGKRSRIVFGNIDDPSLRHRFPEDIWFTCEGLRIWITHIAGSPPRYNTRTRHLLQHEKPDILVCGHSHILKVIHDDKIPVLYLNPGAAGNAGFHPIRTMLRFEINNSKAERMEVIEMGRRGTVPG